MFSGGAKSFIVNVHTHIDTNIQDTDLTIEETYVFLSEKLVKTAFKCPVLVLKSTSLLFILKLRMSVSPLPELYTFARTMDKVVKY